MNTPTPTPRTDAESFLSRGMGIVPTLPKEAVRIDFSRTLERELTAAREESDKWEQLAHDKLSEVCRQIEKTRAVTEQRDRLAEALKMITTFDYSDFQCDNGYGARSVATEALQSLNPDHFPDVGNMIGTTTTEP